jgi:hypothetical protein
MGDETNTQQESAKPKRQEVESFSVIPEAQRTEGNPDAVKVRLQRVGEEPVICVSIEFGGGITYWRPDAAKLIFDVDAITAAAAVRTGGFEVHPDSRTRLK